MGTDRPTDLEQQLTELSRGKLRPRDDLREVHWLFWERCTLNLHRLVALCSYGPSAARELEHLTRETLGRHFRCAWWRGLGFGLVLEVREAAGFPDEFQPLVDGRANSQGTWQWLILVSHTRKRAWGLHTWIEGYLSPVYRGLLLRLEEQGYEIASVRKQKDGLLKALTAMKPSAFPEFDNALGEGTRPPSHR